MLELGKTYVVRTTYAGVHVGTLAAADLGTKTVHLTNARRIWRWRGANTLHELSVRGADMKWTRISDPVEDIYIMDVIELIPCSSVAAENLTQSRWSSQ